MGKTVEETYKKIDNLEHVLLRPDMYVGSIETTKEKLWVYDDESGKLVLREIELIPALYKIYDEILVNAADNKVRDPTQTMIKVDIDKENNEISIMNNGKGKKNIFFVIFYFKIQKS
jgi:DNA topoisomerase-2